MAKSGVSKRPKLVPVSEETRHVSAMLAQELLLWPDVSERPMFGMRAFYRGAIIFAMLPEKRAFATPTAIAYKLSTGAQRREGRKWKLFEFKGGRAASDALACLDRAYRNAESVRK